MADKKYEELKYLGFVEAVGTLVTVCIVRAYKVGKDWSRPRIKDIKCKISAAVAQLYHLILLFFDHMLDVCVDTVRKHAPQVLTVWLDMTVGVTKKVSDLMVDVSEEVQRVGVVATTKTYYGKLLPLAVKWMHLAWEKLLKLFLKHFLKLPFSLNIMDMAGSPALFLGEKANKVLSSLKEHKLPFTDLVPLLPLNNIGSIIKTQTKEHNLRIIETIMKKQAQGDSLHLADYVPHLPFKLPTSASTSSAPEASTEHNSSPLADLYVPLLPLKRIQKIINS